MFQFAHCPPSCLWVQQAVSRHHSGGVAPLGISGLMACMQLPRNVSPVSASFIGLQRQGIHPVLCRACALDSGLLLSACSSWPHGQEGWVGVFEVFVSVFLCFVLLGDLFSAKSKLSFLVVQVRCRCPNT